MLEDDDDTAERGGGEVMEAVSERMRARGRSNGEISRVTDCLVTNALSSREALLESNYKSWIPLGLPVGLMMEAIGPMRAVSTRSVAKTEPYTEETGKQFVTVGTHREEVIEWPKKDKTPYLQLLDRTVETYGGTDDESRRITWQFIEMKPREIPRPLFSAMATFPLKGNEKGFRGPWVLRKKDAQKACAKLVLESIDLQLPANEREFSIALADEERVSAGRCVEKAIEESRTNPIGEANTLLQRMGMPPGKFTWRTEIDKVGNYETLLRRKKDTRHAFRSPEGLQNASPPSYKAFLQADCLAGRAFVGEASVGKEAKFNAARELIRFITGSPEQLISATTPVGDETQVKEEGF
ncbi:hypothetical protein FOL47_003868 [Perkinsus chesapeaki]|uniref:Uncharacterized protein n=1 Tax=Perkinsus chesapeaki TaxID=330153 RepID=A0A7J6M5T7_PERCH|nr:hypothetical protein FOL47_003868 [Perkinsus chesapeaki]